MRMGPLISPPGLFAVLTTTDPSPLRIAFAWSSVSVKRPNLPDVQLLHSGAAATGADPVGAVITILAPLTGLDRLE